MRLRYYINYNCIIQRVLYTDPIPRSLYLLMYVLDNILHFFFYVHILKRDL